jgi:ubiquinone/menaquinone biosynthesis C-methylase UbiE
MRLRSRAVERLELRRGDRVVDAACGTGLNFPLLHAYVGDEGAIVGVDLSPDMLSKAHERVRANGWRNVTLIESSVEKAAIPNGLDAALFSLTHDVMRSPAALNNVVGSLGENGRVAALGAKWAPRWAVPVNVIVRLVSRSFVTTLEGYDRPWSHLEQLISDLRVEPVVFGAAYVAWGTK